MSLLGIILCLTILVIEAFWALIMYLRKRRVGHNDASHYYRLGSLTVPVTFYMMLAISVSTIPDFSWYWPPIFVGLGTICWLFFLYLAWQYQLNTPKTESLG